MLFELVIVVCVAFAGAGVVVLPAKLLRRKTPKTLALVAAGLAMFAYVQWDRYTWAERYASSLPEGSAVIASFPYEGIAEPWALVFPRADRLLVVDKASALTNPAYPHVSLVTTLLVERNTETLALRQFVDCVQRRRAPVTGEVHFTEEGLPAAEAWVAGGEPKALYDTLCGAR
ncbi:MAG: hypothetical protein AB1918_06005 [Pseudomonadota bacterium]